MLKQFIYIVFFLLAVSACETVYEGNIDLVSNAIVVETHITGDETNHEIKLNWSRDFYSEDYIEPVSGASVTVVDNHDNAYECREIPYGIYDVSFKVIPTRKYKLLISYGGELYESEYETVPEPPAIDTLYGEEYLKVIQQGGETSVDNFREILGQQFYVDIINNDSAKYYRFYARKILQYYFIKDTFIFAPVQIQKYCWKSFYPNGTFNIAGPNDYSGSKNIYKHPVEFFRYTEEALLDSGQVGLGWIYIIHEYGITKSTFQFYTDLNSQLEANGKIFDPLFTQARGNMRCTSDKNKTILGNFEVASYRQYRYYLRIESNVEKQYVRKLDTFYNIPEKGIKTSPPPDFWED
ncbi:MAG TPA: DUF4249 domain-containing protein [Draconibacterium sp.]|nr:DUF4249 domain-containing protein [Draconibacterium sp.]